MQVVSDPKLDKSGTYWSWNQGSGSFENQVRKRGGSGKGRQGSSSDREAGKGEQAGKAIVPECIKAASAFQQGCWHLSAKPAQEGSNGWQLCACGMKQAGDWVLSGRLAARWCAGV